MPWIVIATNQRKPSTLPACPRTYDPAQCDNLRIEGSFEHRVSNTFPVRAALGLALPLGQDVGGKREVEQSDVKPQWDGAAAILGGAVNTAS